MSSLNYSLFIFRACVDWIEFEITTLNATRGPHIRKKMQLPSYVEPIDAGAAKEATRFKITYQDPSSWAELIDFIDRLEERFPLAGAPIITGIEITFDAYRNGATDAQMEEMCLGLFKFATFSPSKNQRFSGRWAGDVSAIETDKQVLRMIGQDRVINLGNKDDEISMRIYLKKKDAGALLPPEKHRARREVTLRGNAVPFRTFAEASAYAFTELRPYFKFRKKKESLSDLDEVLMAHTPQAGIRQKRVTADHSLRWHDRRTPADTRLNRIAYDALRGLSRSMQKTSPRGRKPK